MTREGGTYMIIPNKVTLRVYPHTDDKVIVAKMVADVLHNGEEEKIKDSFDNLGYYDAGDFYSDIALSKRFKICQQANELKLFNLSVSTLNNKQ